MSHAQANVAASKPNSGLARLSQLILESRSFAASFLDFASSMKAFRSPFRDASRISTETSSPDLSQPKITSLSSNSSSANTPFLTLTTRTSASGSYRIKLHCCLLFKIRNLTGHFQIKLGTRHSPRLLSLNPPTRSTQQNQQSSRSA